MLFYLHRFAFSVRPIFGAHTKMGEVIFVCLYIFMAGVQLSSLPLHIHLLTFKLKSSLYFCLVSQRGPCLFLMVPHLCRRYGTPGFFLVMFNYHSHSLVTGWPTISALAWVTQRSGGCSHRFCLLFLLKMFFFFFYLSLLPQKLASSLYNLNLPYHITGVYFFYLFLVPWQKKI